MKIVEVTSPNHNDTMDVLRLDRSIRSELSIIESLAGQSLEQQDIDYVLDRLNSIEHHLSLPDYAHYQDEFSSRINLIRDSLDYSGRERLE
jgi:hypothetical protein